MPHQCTTCGRSFEDGSKDMLSGCPDCGGNKFQFQPAAAVDGSTGGNTSGGTASAATAQKKTPESARSTQKPRSSATESVETGETVNPDERVKSDERAKTGATDAPETGGNDRASAVNRAAETVRDWVGKRTDDDSSRTSATGSTRNDTSEQDNTPSKNGTTAGTAGSSQTPKNSVPKSEDSAQASARRDVVSESELPDEPPQNAATADPPDDSDTVADSNTDANVVDAPDDQSPGLNELREELNSQFESIRIEEPGQYELNLMELYEREEYIISLQEDGKYVIEVPDAWDATDR